MSRADINLKSNLSKENSNHQMNFDDFDGVWQELDDVSEISFELHLPKDKIKKDSGLENAPQKFLDAEELMMRQNLMDLAIKENITIRENKDDALDVLVKSSHNQITKAFELNLKNLSEDDIRFFQLLADKQNISINNQNSIIVDNNGQQENLSNLKFSKSLLNLIEYSLKSQRPIRIDFAQNASVILRITPQGMVSAEFIAADKAMEHLLKTNIPHLRKKLDGSGIKYKKIYYRDEEKE